MVYLGMPEVRMHCVFVFSNNIVFGFLGLQMQLFSLTKHISSTAVVRLFSAGSYEDQFTTS